jgi:enamine deaminase RidA (YjgF/YER057c/UK114 family)
LISALRDFTLPCMTDHTLAKIESLGLKLPVVPTPIAAYVNCVRTGNLLFLSGGLPIDGDVKILGKVPSACPVEKAVEGAKR